MAKKRITLLVMMRAFWLGAAAQSASIGHELMVSMVDKYDESKNVNGIVCTKGNGLEMIKMMLNKEFGKDFMKGVTSITIIDYSDASEDVCAVLRKDLDAFLSILKEFDVSKEKQFADNDYIRCFASASNSGILSDFVIALENDKSKTVMYMAGKISISE